MRTSEGVTSAAAVVRGDGATARLVGYIAKHAKSMRVRSDHRLVISGETKSPVERLKRVQTLVQDLGRLAA